jgi:hypothetical protein
VISAARAVRVDRAAGAYPVAYPPDSLVPSAGEWQHERGIDAASSGKQFAFKTRAQIDGLGDCAASDASLPFGEIQVPEAGVRADVQGLSARALRNREALRSSDTLVLPRRERIPPPPPDSRLHTRVSDQQCEVASAAASRLRPTTVVHDGVKGSTGQVRSPGEEQITHPGGKEKLPGCDPGTGQGPGESRDEGWRVPSLTGVQIGSWNVQFNYFCGCQHGPTPTARR